MRRSNILSLILLVGTVFAFYTVIGEFIDFYKLEGTIFKVKDCILPNPATTPCFYGAFGFLIALVWSVKLLKFENMKKKLHQKYLMRFLLAGSLFAWFNAGRGILDFYKVEDARFEGAVGCSGQLVTNPFTTACFIGATLFLLSFLYSLYIYYSNRKIN